MLGKLNGKTAIITGASSGIGKTVAVHLSDEGANVVLVARREQKIKDLAEKINAKDKGRALAIATDVSKRLEVEQMAEKVINEFGQVDIYVNNAGVMLESTVQGGNVENWEQMIDINMKGVLYGINAVLPQMIGRSTGHIINISSVAGHEVTKVNTVYSATKFAVRVISMGLEKELARTGVRVTNISPGLVDTDLANWRNSKEQPTNETRKIQRKPLHTNDIARAIVYAVTQPAYVNVNEITIRPV